MIRIGLVGFGYWGPNLARNIAEVEGALLAAVCEIDDSRLGLAKQIYPYIDGSREFRHLIEDPTVDAIAIATPLGTHYELASQALMAGKHVLIEKPLTADASSARELVKTAGDRGLVLMVDHTFLYTGAVRKIHDLVSEKSLGDIYYYDSTRVNLGIFQHDTNVVWDLATHDLSILDYVIDERPIAVSANGMSHFPGNFENLAYLTLFFPSQMIAHINVNWLAPVKVRRTLIGGSDKMVVYDDMEPSEKVKVYDKGIDVTDDQQDIYNMLISYRSGDMWAPKLDQTEALKLEIEHFIHCVVSGEQPVTDGEMGLRVVTILEAATESMTRRGESISLKG